MTDAEALADVRARIAALETAPICSRCRLRRVARAAGGVFAGFVVVVALGLTLLLVLVEHVFTFPPVGVN